jgi:hypothetical protein
MTALVNGNDVRVGQRRPREDADVDDVEQNIHQLRAVVAGLQHQANILQVQLYLNHHVVVALDQETERLREFTAITASVASASLAVVAGTTAGCSAPVTGGLALVAGVSGYMGAKWATKA